MFWVYILENSRGIFYIGQTKDITARLEDHNRTDAFEGHFTRKSGPWNLVWTEPHNSRSRR
jgi:predicted GIY-YIG superfamily endonuclease